MPLSSNRLPIVKRVFLRKNVFTESLPSNGYTRHNINCVFGTRSLNNLIIKPRTGSPPAPFVVPYFLRKIGHILPTASLFQVPYHSVSSLETFLGRFRLSRLA
jgi:hypothetical protein